MRTSHLGLVVLVLVLASLACGSSVPPVEGPASDAEEPAPDAADALTVAEEAVPAVVEEPIPATRAIDPAVIASAERGRGTDEGRAAATASLRAGAQGDELWGAVYVYSTEGDDPALLQPLLVHADATIRVLAAGGLLRLGDKAGFPVLVAETNNRSTLAGSEPPQPIGEIAAIMLGMGSGERYDIAPGEATKTTWSDWYHTHADKLVFDAENGWSSL